MNTNSQKSYSAVFAGMVLFILWGLTLISMEIPLEWKFPAWIPVISLISMIFVLPVGMCIGWILNFPRWSYPYVGHTLVFSLYMTNVATPGFLFGREIWGWRAWIPLLVIAGIALIITRSLHPILKLFTNIWNDWTLLTFGLFGFMPLLVLIAFDEMDRLYSLYFMILITLLMCGTAFLYMRANIQRGKIFALFTGILLITVISLITPTLYWRRTGWVSPWEIMITASIVVLFMFSPAMLGLISGLVSHKTV